MNGNVMRCCTAIPSTQPFLGPRRCSSLPGGVAGRRDVVIEHGVRRELQHAAGDVDRAAGVARLEGLDERLDGVGGRAVAGPEDVQNELLAGLEGEHVSPLAARAARREAQRAALGEPLAEGERPAPLVVLQGERFARATRGGT